MSIKYLIAWSVFVASAWPLKGQNDNDGFIKALNNINQSVLKAQLEFLASDWTEGRKAGEKGEHLAADYIASMLQVYGVKPGGDSHGERGMPGALRGKERTYFQNFFLIKTTPGDEQVMKVRTTENNSFKTISFTNNIDFTMRPSGQDIEIEAPVVFVGYGIKNEKLRHDDFNNLDIKGKFILKISGSPGFARAVLSPSELSAASREAEIIARKMGATGIIEFNPELTVVGSQPLSDFQNMSPSENNPAFGRQWTSYSLPEKEAWDNLVRITVSVKVANEILKGAGIVLDDFVKKSESKSYGPVPEIKGKSIFLKSTVRKETVRVRNVIGFVEGKNPDQVIVVGAHYDHIGTGNGYIWNGADDNGSGTVGVMTIAKAVMETGIKPARTIVFALWSAEEEGLLGSRHYIKNLSYPQKNLHLNVNFDMISRYITDDDPNKVTMTYTESLPEFRTITEENITKYGIDLDVEYQPSKDPPGGSDHRSFVDAGIPVIRFKPGHREQYHTPDDEISTVNWDIMEKIIKISFADIWYLSNNDW